MQKKTLIGLALVPLGALALFGHFAHAQNNVNPAQTRLERIARRLHMTPQQEDQARTIITQARAQAQTIRANQALTTGERRAQLMALGQTTRKQIAALLTPTQRQQVHQGIKQRLERVADQLGLSQDQRTQIKSILTDGRQQVKAVRQDTSLTTDQKRAQVRTIMQTTRQQALAVLTPTQRQQFDALKAQWRQRMADAGAAQPQQ